MIRQEIMDVVDVEDILKIYRVVPKIVEVEKVVEKVIEKIVEVPKMIPVESTSSFPVETKRVEVVENVRNVPIEVQVPVPITEQKVVKVPEYIEKAVESTRLQEQYIESVREIPKARAI